jgi:flagellar biosynthetic protein FliO
VTFSSVIGAVLTLGLVLTLVVVTMRLLRRVTNGSSGTRQAGPRLEIVQRLALGPRQGIAVVRVGDQLLAVSVGDGGVDCGSFSSLRGTPQWCVGNGGK